MNQPLEVPLQINLSSHYVKLIGTFKIYKISSSMNTSFYSCIFHQPSFLSMRYTTYTASVESILPRNWILHELFLDIHFSFFPYMNMLPITNTPHKSPTQKIGNISDTSTSKRRFRPQTNLQDRSTRIIFGLKTLDEREVRFLSIPQVCLAKRARLKLSKSLRLRPPCVFLELIVLWLFQWIFKDFSWCPHQESDIMVFKFLHRAFSSKKTLIL